MDRRKSSTIERKDIQADTLSAPSKEYLRDSFTDTELTGGFSHSKHNVTRTSNFTDTETDVASTGDVTESETAVATSDTDNETTRSNTSQLLDNSSKSSFFMTEFSSDAESFSKHYVFETSNSKASEKRLRNRTIDLHDLPSLFWEGTVSRLLFPCIDYLLQVGLRADLQVSVCYRTVFKICIFFVHVIGSRLGYRDRFSSQI